MLEEVLLGGQFLRFAQVGSFDLSLLEDFAVGAVSGSLPHPLHHESADDSQDQCADRNEDADTDTDHADRRFLRSGNATRPGTPIAPQRGRRAERITGRTASDETASQRWCRRETSIRTETT